MNHLAELEKSLAGLQITAEYWDVRIEDTTKTSIQMTNGEVITCMSNPSLGAFVRIRRNGFWFYEATTNVEALRAVLERLDRESGDRPADASFTDPQFQGAAQPAYCAQVPHELRFTETKIEDKLKLLQHYDSLARLSKEVINSQFSYSDVFKTKCFLNSLGTKFEYDFNQGGVRGALTLGDGKNIFTNFFRLYGAQFSELVGKEEQLATTIREGAEFLKAPSVIPGKYRVLLSPEVAGVFTHESFGHKSEADFLIGNDEALAEWTIGKKIAASCLSIVDCGLHENTSGYCPIDDEGMPAQKNYLIKDGALVGRLHSLETAQLFNEKPTGNGRAIGFEWEPIVRMTSTYIEPGNETLDSILERCEGLLLIEGVRHGSGLSTFTIAPERGYRILKNGQREPVRISVVSGSLFETLNNVEAVSQDFELFSSAFGGCGKMEQWPLPVADGGPYVLVKEMQVS